MESLKTLVLLSLPFHLLYFTSMHFSKTILVCGTQGISKVILLLINFIINFQLLKINKYSFSFSTRFFTKCKSTPQLYGLQENSNPPVWVFGKEAHIKVENGKAILTDPSESKYAVLEGNLKDVPEMKIKVQNSLLKILISQNINANINNYIFFKKSRSISSSIIIHKTKSISISELDDGASLANVIQLLKEIYEGPNFISALLIIGGTALSCHFSGEGQNLEISPIVAIGSPVTAKTTAVKAAFSVLGQHNCKHGKYVFSNYNH